MIEHAFCPKCTVEIQNSTAEIFECPICHGKVAMSEQRAKIPEEKRQREIAELQEEIEWVKQKKAGCAPQHENETAREVYAVPRRILKRLEAEKETAESLAQERQRVEMLTKALEGVEFNVRYAHQPENCGDHCRNSCRDCVLKNTLDDIRTALQSIQRAEGER